jgi:copper homeostasis protein
LGTVRAAVRLARIPIHVMVRPRGGDFLYSDAEFAGMVADIEALRDTGAAGAVFGCLTAEGDIDEDRMRRLVACARPMTVTCHRAFDMTRDPAEALEALIRCGADRVLTSGRGASADIGVLRRLGALAAGRIVVMGCGGLTPETIGAVRSGTGLEELHFAALREVPSAMRYRNAAIAMGSLASDREYLLMVTDSALVRATITAAQ